MSYNNYTSEDFFHDPKFRQWILNPDPELNYFWEKWCLANPKQMPNINLARELVQSIQIEEYQWGKGRKEKLWQRIQQTHEQKNTINDTRVVSLNSYTYNREKNRFAKLVKSGWLKAAVISTVLVFSWLVFKDLKDQPEDISTPEIVKIDKQNPSGQKSKIFLPDGSVVLLNSNSKLTYSPEFSEKERVVYLSGEAFFEIVKDSLRPFIVHTQHLHATVLGTSFNVNAFAENERIDIALVEGKLKISNTQNNQEVTLSPGQSATLAKSDNQLSTGTVDYLSDIAWKDGILYFNDMPLTKVFQLLQQWYGVNFHFNQKPVESIQITGKFENEYLTNVLKSLSYSVEFNYEFKKGNDVYIKFN